MNLLFFSQTPGYIHSIVPGSRCFTDHDPFPSGWNFATFYEAIAFFGVNDRILRDTARNNLPDILEPLRELPKEARNSKRLGTGSDE